MSTAIGGQALNVTSVRMPTGCVRVCSDRKVMLDIESLIPLTERVLVDLETAVGVVVRLRTINERSAGVASPGRHPRLRPVRLLRRPAQAMRSPIFWNMAATSSGSVVGSMPTA